VNKLIWVEWGSLLVGLGSISLLEAYHPLAVVGGFALLISWAARWARTGSLAVRSGLELPWFLFLLSGVVAVWVAYARDTAFLQFTRIFAVASLYYASAQSTEKLLKWVIAGFVLGVSGLAIYWLGTHDFGSAPPKFSLLAEVGSRLNDIFSLPVLTIIHSNVIAGTLALALPFGASLVWIFWRQRNRAMAVVIAFAALIMPG